MAHLSIREWVQKFSMTVIVPFGWALGAASAAGGGHYAWAAMQVLFAVCGALYIFHAPLWYMVDKDKVWDEDGEREAAELMAKEIAALPLQIYEKGPRR